MALRPCSVEGCPKTTGQPGTARGWCGMHYQRWRAYGDPTMEPPSRKRYCTIDGCAKPHYGRGMCALHYDRWRDGRDLHHPERWVSRPNGLRRCSTCRAEKRSSDFYPNRSRTDGLMVDCKGCCRSRRRERPRTRRPRVELVCDVCGVPFMGDKRRSRRCGDECTVAAKRREDLTITARRRRKIRDAEPVSRDVVFNRDNWLCGICDGAINPQRKYPDPSSASIDHIVPVSRGGAHTYENVQAAHLVCNLRKGTREEVA